jgi:predicted class III extradiol MEMO1 family dioxygenase
VIEELSKTGLFAAASPSTEIEEHSIEMHLPFVYKAFER